MNSKKLRLGQVLHRNKHLRADARTVFGIVLVVGAVAQLPVLWAARAQQPPGLGQPHGKLGAAGNALAALYQRLCRRQQQLCPHGQGRVWSALRLLALGLPGQADHILQGRNTPVQ